MILDSHYQKTMPKIMASMIKKRNVAQLRTTVISQSTLRTPTGNKA